MHKADFPHKMYSVSAFAFDQDCTHTLMPVSDGCRVEIVYDLVAVSHDVPRPPHGSLKDGPHLQRLVETLPQTMHKPWKFLFLLGESYYTNTGNDERQDLDALATTALQEAIQSTAYCMEEVEVSINRSFGEHDFGENEVYDESIYISSRKFGKLDFSADEILQPVGRLEDLGETEMDEG